MRLLNVQDDGEFSLVEYLGEHVPPYAILSHTWGADHEEVTFRDLLDDKDNKNKKVGYQKIRFCSAQAAKDGLSFFWIDTCCIDKSSSAELTEAINSMFRWYRNAAKCYVYLSDVSVNDEQSFHTSRWFTRGWTLQELLAPTAVEFFSVEEEIIGNRASMVHQIKSITGIPATALQGQRDLATFAVDQRLSWAKNRVTKRPEDAAYSLLGLCGVHIPLIYGEGRKSAFTRLRREIEFSSGNAPKQVFFNTPFRRDSDFIDRGTILEDIHRIISEPGSCAAIFGLGGVGKSQLAIEYSYLIQDIVPSMSVYWIHAGTQTRFKEGYQRIAEMAKMNGWDNPKLDTLQLVYNWLCDRKTGWWLMVIDNADDEAVFFDQSAQDRMVDQSTKMLSDYIPQSKNGRIFITSRNRDLAYRLTGSYRSIIEVRPMDRKDALSLLDKKLNPEIDRENAAELLDALDYMPLAITQAAAYIQQRASRMSVTRYLDEFRKSERDQSRLLTKDLGDARRDGRSSNSIIATWQTSFEHIRTRMPTAARLLALMCLFDRQGIPETLLHGRYTEEEGDADFEDDIQTLISYSLIEMGSEGNFEMHRLVQVSTRKWLEINHELEQWKGVFTKLLHREFSTSYTEDLAYCHTYLPHVQAVIDCRPNNSTSLELWASLLHKTSIFTFNLGHYAASEQMELISLETRKALLGLEHPDTLESMYCFARLLREKGSYNAAEAIWKSLLDSRRRLLGAEHPDTLLSMDGLACAYMDLKQLQKAEELGIEVIELKKKVLGSEHPDTLSSIANQALVYDCLGRWQDAAELGVEVAEKLSRILGPRNASTLSVKRNLAALYREMGRLEEAEVLATEVFEISRDVFGYHPDTLLSMAELVTLYQDREEWDKAEEMAMQVLSLRKHWLGENHPYTLTSMAWLATVYYTQGRYDKAEELNTLCFERRKKVLGSRHCFTLKSMSNIAWTWKYQDKQDDAISLMEECAQLQREALGSEHPDTVKSMEDLNKLRLEDVEVDVEEHHDTQDDAISLMEERAKLQMQDLGSEHSGTLESLEDLDNLRLEDAQVDAETRSHSPDSSQDKPLQS